MSNEWDDEVDIVVVGFGLAGASAAVEASDHRAEVFVLDRFGGGGASALSGGVIYAGGGTRHQREAGYEDTPENMFNYLRHECGGAVSDETLLRFCEGSRSDLEWLESFGAEFGGRLCELRTAHPTHEYDLYFSGNEEVSGYRDESEPAPRGHRARSNGQSGQTLFDAVAAAARARGARVRTEAPVTRLLTEGSGAVVGAEYRAAEQPRVDWARRKLFNASRRLNNYAPAAAAPINAVVRRLEGMGRTHRVRARRGVILTTGGFIHSRHMMREYAPEYLPGRPIGTLGDDGSGVRLGQSVGGAADWMNSISLWRFIVPPAAMVKGVLVDSMGRRLCNEELYGATVGQRMMAKDGRAWLVLDQPLYEEAVERMPIETVAHQRPQVEFLFSRFGHRKSLTLAGLAQELDLDAGELEDTIERYNRGAATGDDELGKNAHRVQALLTAPYYAIDCSYNDLGLRQRIFYPCPKITLGGLVVDEETGRVKRRDGSTIDGLFAAGRSAVGLCSASYVSGLSLADCVFSGRRAGRSAAMAG